MTTDELKSSAESTIEELEQYHLQTLRLVIERLNTFVEEQREAQRRRQEAQASAAAEHARRVQETAARLKFDN